MRADCKFWKGLPEFGNVVTLYSHIDHRRHEDITHNNPFAHYPVGILQAGGLLHCNHQRETFRGWKRYDVVFLQFCPGRDFCHFHSTTERRLCVHRLERESFRNGESEGGYRHNGINEITDLAATVEGWGSAVEPEVVTLSQLVANYAKYESAYVKVIGVTASATSGNGNADVTLTFAANESTDAVTYTATATADGCPDVTITITQN